MYAGAVTVMFSCSPSNFLSFFSPPAAAFNLIWHYRARFLVEWRNYTLARPPPPYNVSRTRRGVKWDRGKIARAHTRSQTIMYNGRTLVPRPPNLITGLRASSSTFFFFFCLFVRGEERKFQSKGILSTRRTHTQLQASVQEQSPPSFSSLRCCRLTRIFCAYKTENFRRTLLCSARRRTTRRAFSERQ